MSPADDPERTQTPPLTAEGPTPTEALPSAMPERLGEFRVLRELGRGGGGVVYEAEQVGPVRRVALKVLPATGDEARFRREVENVARLHHGNIVPVFSAG